MVDLTKSRAVRRVNLPETSRSARRADDRVTPRPRPRGGSGPGHSLCRRPGRAAESGVMTGKLRAPMILGGCGAQCTLQLIVSARRADITTASGAAWKLRRTRAA